jgi:hypothetical protein
VTDRRFGVYLRPSPAMCRAQAELHDLLARQYNLHAAGRFMPHVTLKGFFRSDASLETIVARLVAALAGRAAFPVWNGGVVPYLKSAIVLDVHRDEQRNTNAPLQRLHEAAFDAVLPLVRADCDFTPEEWSGPRFHAHLTLAMADVPERFFDEILAFVQAFESIGPRTFTAEIVQLFAFASDDWPGRWLETLRWELLHSWQLPAAGEITS